MDPALLRGMTQRRFSRRDALKYGGYASMAAFLAACGVRGTANKGASASPSQDLSKIYGDGKPAGVLNFANWENYIDVDAKGNSPTLQQFTKDTGIKVNYRTAVSDNAPFLAKIIPLLQAGQDTGYDLIVVTNGGFIERLINLDYLLPLDHQYLPNFEKYASEAVKDPSYDPGNRFTVAWQSGFTAIAYNSKVVDPPPTSFADLLDTKHKGKVGMFNNDQDLACPALVHLGKDIQTSTPDDWKEAADLLIKQRDDGIVRAYYENDFIDALESGETVLTQAWSGDVFVASASKDLGGDGYPELKLVTPEEGAILFTDNQGIPKGAKHPVDAIMMMDYVYQPEIAAQLADFIWYVSPVPAAKDVVLNELDDPEVANSPLVFPSTDALAKSHKYKVFKDNDEREEWLSIFEPIYTS